MMPSSTTLRSSLPTLALTLSLVTAVASAPAQNVIDSAGGKLVAPPLELPDARLRASIWRVPRSPSPRELPTEARRVAEKLDRHVRDYLAHRPFLPFHMTLGISGHQTLFVHPSQMAAALALAIPHLPVGTARAVRTALRAEIDARPVYLPAPPSPPHGRARERYPVPPSLRDGSPRRPPDAFGVWAFWAYVHYGEDPEVLARHWPRIRERMTHLLERAYEFEVEGPHRRDEARRLEADLAGVIATARLARRRGDETAEARATVRAEQMLALRIDLDRRNPRILDESRTAASNSLHMSQLSRYQDLTPAVGRAIRELTEGISARRLEEFRRDRNGWWIAFGPRLVGGENYTSPPGLSRAMFDAALLIEERPAEELLGWVDIPWCRGDAHFVAKCAGALWAASGRGWESLE